MTNDAKDRPKIGIALSGASGRAIAHIGVLEVLREYKIPIDIITACSSGTVVAGSFASGTMQKLKEEWFKWDKKFIMKLFEIEDTTKGLLSTDRIADWFRQYFNHNFEDVEPRLGFVCVDVVSGQPVTLALGDLTKAAQASYAVPGLFEPVEWGNKLLVDGGLISLIPAVQAREMGADIVIGVDIAATRYMYKKRYINAWRGYNFVKKSLPFRILKLAYSLFDRLYESSVKFIFYSQADFFEQELVKKDPNLLSILAKGLEIASEEHKKGLVPPCDIMLSPDVKKKGKMDFESAKRIYLEGRRVALEAIPEIEKLIENYQKPNNDT